MSELITKSIDISIDEILLKFINYSSKILLKTEKNINDFIKLLPKLQNDLFTMIHEIALILPYVVVIKEQIKKTNNYGLIIDNKNSSINLNKTLNNITLINLFNNTDYNTIAYEICSCTKIITGSLLGLVFSFSLNVPVIWIKDENSVDYENISKFLNLFSYIKIPSYCNDVKQINNTNIESFVTLSSNSHVTEKKLNIFSDLVKLLKSNYGISNLYDKKIYKLSDGFNLISDIMNNKTFFIGRIGGIEFDAYVDFKLNGFNINSIYIKNLFKYCGYYDINYSDVVVKQYFQIFEQYYKNCNIILVGGNKLTSYYKLINVDNPYYTPMYFKNDFLDKVEKNNFLPINHIPKMSYTVLEGFVYFKEFYQKLNNKKVLIISPFEKEIKEQLKIKNKLFTRKSLMTDFTNFEYPEFAKVEFINTFLTTNQFHLPHKNIIETFENYKTILHQKDFDVALLICGAYAYLFGNYIHNVMNKSCVHVGGIGQLFFGIKGGRYMTPYFESLMNEHWIYPYTIIEKNALNVPDCDGLLGYFKRK